MTRLRRRLTPLVLVAAVALAACTPALPESVVPGTVVTVSWSGEFTSTNAQAAPTPGNIDLAATMRAGFGALVDGEFVADTSFGTVTILDEEPFTVRYDLAEPAWSDGTPLDAADLVLGWAAAAGYLDPEAASVATAAPPIESSTPSVDEFARSIEFTLPAPRHDWQQLITVAVPAHVVAERAFDLDDAMEAKQRVLRAFEEHDTAAIVALGAAWRDTFTLPESGEIDPDVLLSSGPYLVDDISGSLGSQRITLVPNSAYTGVDSSRVARVELVPPPEDPLAVVGKDVDVIEVVPLASNRAAVQALERVDFTVNTSNDGTVWALLLNPSGVFTAPAARLAFLHVALNAGMVERGAGVWPTVYPGSQSMLSAPGDEAYTVVVEDSGFAGTIGTPGEDLTIEREQAGIAEGTSVCVLYDRTSEFSVGAFTALRDASAEYGWTITDCGSDDFETAVTSRTWAAVIAPVPLARTAPELAALWGSGGELSITGHADPARDELISQFAATTDVYQAREILADIEATIVAAAIAFPLATNPRIVIAARDVTGVTVRSGDLAPVLSGLSGWETKPE